VGGRFAGGIRGRSRVVSAAGTKAREFEGWRIVMKLFSPRFMRDGAGAAACPCAASAPALRPPSPRGQDWIEARLTARWRMDVVLVVDPVSGDLVLSRPRLAEPLAACGYPDRPVRELAPLGVCYAWQVVQVTPAQVIASGLFGRYVTSILALVSKTAVGVPMGTPLSEDVVAHLMRVTQASPWRLPAA